MKEKRVIEGKHCVSAFECWCFFSSNIFQWYSNEMYTHARVHAFYDMENKQPWHNSMVWHQKCSIHSFNIRHLWLFKRQTLKRIALFPRMDFIHLWIAHSSTQAHTHNAIVYSLTQMHTQLYLWMYVSIRYTVCVCVCVCIAARSYNWIICDYYFVWKFLCYMEYITYNHTQIAIQSHSQHSYPYEISIVESESIFKMIPSDKNIVINVIIVMHSSLCLWYKILSKQLKPIGICTHCVWCVCDLIWAFSLI